MGSGGGWNRIAATFSRLGTTLPTNAVASGRPTASISSSSREGRSGRFRRRPAYFDSQPKPFQLTSSPLSLSSPLPSKDGKKLFVVGQTYRGELMRYDAKVGPALSRSWAEFRPSTWTFPRTGSGSRTCPIVKGTLWRSKIDGTERLQLTYPPMYPVLPRWSPDGKKIIFFEFALSAITCQDLRSFRRWRQLRVNCCPTITAQQLDPNWSPDGSKIMFAGESNNPASSIRILDLATEPMLHICRHPKVFTRRDGLPTAGTSLPSQRIQDSASIRLQTQKWSELASGSLSWLNWSHDSKFVYVLDYRG